MNRKSIYLARDSIRAARRVGISDVSFPHHYSLIGFTDLHQCTLQYIKSNYPESVYLSAMQSLFDGFWTPPHMDMNKVDDITQNLSKAVCLNDGKTLFNGHDLMLIANGLSSARAKVKEETNRAFSLGAFGTPWFWVTNNEGQSDVFFGSDR